MTNDNNIENSLKSDKKLKNILWEAINQRDWISGGNLKRRATLTEALQPLLKVINKEANSCTDNHESKWEFRLIHRDNPLEYRLVNRSDDSEKSSDKKELGIKFLLYTYDPKSHKRMNFDFSPGDKDLSGDSHPDSGASAESALVNAKSVPVHKKVELQFVHFADKDPVNLGSLQKLIDFYRNPMPSAELQAESAESAVDEQVSSRFNVASILQACFRGLVADNKHNRLL